MTNFGEMQTRIADELNRYDLDEYIPRAIRSAIYFYEKEPLGFNEAITELTNDKAQECIQLPPYIKKVTSLHIMNEGSPCKVRYKPHMDFFQGFGFPQYYTPIQNKLVFAPIPHKEITFRVGYIAKASELKNKSDSNFWLQEGEELIRARAKADLYMHILRSYPDGKVMKDLEKESLTKFKSVRNESQFTGYIHPTAF